MGSLLDKVLASKDSPSADIVLSPKDDGAHVLPDGAVVYDSTIAAINRILELNPHLHKRLTGIRSHPYALYNQHTQVDLTDRRTLLSLLRADWTPCTHYQLVFLEQKVIELAPVLSYRSFFIPPNLLWDSESATLKVLTDQEMKGLHTVS